RIFYLLGIIMGILLSLSSAKADEWSRNYQVEATIDLIHPGSVPVWKDVGFEGVMPDGQWAELGLYLICKSESDTTFGACTTNYKAAGNTAPAGNVLLRFTNIKTRATIDLTVTGKWRTACGNYGDGFTGNSGACIGSGSFEFDANLTETELRKLPYGGVWDARMQLKTMERPNKPIGDVVTDIRLNVRSEASISIPNPTVKLPVTMTGHSEPVTVD
ncbi:CfaE/CblD family pilus tip adhesin, partial [Yersinia enterocolitica]